MHTTNRRNDSHRQAQGEQLRGGLSQMVTVLLIGIVIGLNNVAAQIPSRESVRRGQELVPAPGWFKGFTRLGQMFRLYPPEIPMLEVKPVVEKVRFPARYAVMTVNQMDYRDGQLWILALDECPMPKPAGSAGFDEDETEEHTRIWRLKGDRLRAELYAPGSMPEGVNAFLLQGGELWLAGETVSVWDFKRERLRRFGPAEGLTMKDVEGLAAARGGTFAAGDPFEISFLEPGAGRWVPAEGPPRSDKLSHGTGCPYRLAGGEWVLGYQAGGLFFFDFREQRWTNVKLPGDAACLVPDDDKFWIGAGDGLRQYDPAAQTVRTWTSPRYIESELMSVASSSSGHETVPRREVDYIDSLIRSQLSRTSRAHWRARMARLEENQGPGPFGFNSRMPGGVGAIAKDGEYIWVGANGQHGSRLLLLHKPTETLVGGLRMQGRGTISSLAVSGEHVWVGIGYGDEVLLRVTKGAFLAVPRAEWKELGLGAAEQEQILQGMSRRDQALYAFYTGADERVRDLLGGVDPGKASLEEMFLLGWSCDPLGADNARESTAWFERICERHPDSPWSRAAMQFSATNQALYARFDLNKDGRLEAAEKLVMAKDQDALGFPKPWEFRESDLQQLFSAADQDGDQRLNPIELTAFWNWIPMYFDVGGPLGLSGMRFQADANKDSHLDASEFKYVISEVRWRTEQQRKRHPAGAVPE